MVHSSFSTLSYSELKELQSYLVTHIYGCLSKNVPFPESLYSVLACINTDILMRDSDISYAKSLESVEDKVNESSKEPVSD